MNHDRLLAAPRRVVKVSLLTWTKWIVLYARMSLGAAFLSGIADRFGLWRGRNVGYENFEGFVRYTAKVNAFMPASTIPFLAWAATIAELVLGLLLVSGLWTRWTGLASVLSHI